jgi:hypothetical protein
MEAVGMYVEEIRKPFTRFIPDFWQVDVVLKPEGLAPRTSHRAWPQKGCAYSEKLRLCS